MKRSIVIVGVLLLHAMALWAVQRGLSRRDAEMAQNALPVISVTLPAPAPLSERKPIAPPLSPPAPVAAASHTPPAQARTEQRVAPAPQAAESAPAVSAAPIGLSTAAPAATVPVVGPAASGPNVGGHTATAPASPSPASGVELPSSDADYLHNPKPEYPPMSRKRGEQGKVVVRVLIGVDGTAQKGEIRSSSGFERLDQSALATALRWRYVPGKRGGQPEAMWFDVPIRFAME